MSGYDKTIGYSPLEDVDEVKMLQVIRVNKRIIEDHYLAGPDDRVLVAGAGNGQEALLIAAELQLNTWGVDLHIDKVDSGLPDAKISLQRQDISSLGFLNGVFSIIYCYHVLEHVDDPSMVLAELQRVLKPGGVLFIGFPNKNRLLSYIGTSQKVTFLDKVRWNLQDYLYRVMGKFENRHGAHAGFSEKEFLLLTTPIFSSVHPVRNEYMLYKYTRYGACMKFAASTGFGEFLFPSNYYICVK
jgi:ubiquinone/menaquinone biosynthesis C-methylase UbiE